MGENNFIVRGFVSGEIDKIVTILDGLLSAKRGKKIVIDENTVYYESIFPKITLIKLCDNNTQINIGENRAFNDALLIGNLIQLLQNYFSEEGSGELIIHDLFLDIKIGKSLTEEYLLNLLRLSYVWYRYLTVFTASNKNSYDVSQLPENIRKMIFLSREYTSFEDFATAYILGVNTTMIDVSEVLAGSDTVITAYLGSNLNLIEHLICLYTRLFDYAAVKRTHSSPTKDNLLSTYTLKAKALFKGYDDVRHSRKVLGKVLKDYVDAARKSS